MKKFLIITFIITLCLTLISCNTKEEFNGNPNDIPNASVSITI